MRNAMSVFFLRTAALAAAALLVLAGCGNPAGSGGEDDPKTLVIQGLPAGWTQVSAGIWNGLTDVDGIVAVGEAAVSGGTATVTLKDFDPETWELSGAWTGSGDYYVILWSSGWTADERNPDYATRDRVSFRSGTTSVNYSSVISFEEWFELNGGQSRGEKIGEISGTISLTDIPDPGSSVYISASGSGWSSHSSKIDLSGVSGNSGTLSWTIPLYENDPHGDGGWSAVTGTRTVSFYLYVDLPGSGDDDNYEIRLSQKELDMTSKSGVTAGSLGTASLAYITLSGTISVNDGGSPIPEVNISPENAQGYQIGQISLRSPAANTPWTLYIPVQSGGKVAFRVSGYDSSSGGNQLFYKTLGPDATASVSTADISGIALDIGDIRVGRMSGTVSFTAMPSPAPYRISVSARYGGNNNWTWINNGQGHDVTLLPDGTGTWTIPRDDAFLVALDSGPQTVTFQLNMQLTQDGDSFFVNSTEVTVRKTGLSSITLGTLSLAYVTLSGTITVNDGGSTIPRVYISANNAASNQLSQVSLTSPSANTPWSLNIPAQSGEKITFGVSCYDSSSGGNRLFYKTFEPNATASVSGSVSGIALDIGDISTGRMSGTVDFTAMPSPAPYRISVSAYYGDNNNWKNIGGGSSSTVTVSGAAGTWIIPQDDAFLAFLGNASLPVRFQLYMQLTQDGDSFIIDEVEKTVSKTGLSSINLGTVSLVYVTLSGTVSVTDGGSPIPQVYIHAYNAQGKSAGQVSLTSPSAGASWSMPIPVQGGGQVTFGVSGYDSSYNQLFYKTFESKATASVSTTDIGGIALNIGDISVLSAPSDLRAELWGTNNDVLVSWNPVNEATEGYRVYRNTSAGGEYTFLGTSQPAYYSYVDSGLSAGTYYYKVASVNTSGESELSDYVSIEVPGDGPSVPSAPAGVKVTAQSSSSISVSWSSVSGADSYKVYYETGSSTTKNLAGTATSASYTHTGLQAGTTYKYYITAVNSAGESGYSSAVSTTTSSSGGGGGDTLQGAKGKLTLTGFNEFNGKYVYSALVTSSNKYLIGTNGVELSGGEAVISMVRISGGSAEVPLYTTNVGTTVADIYVPYEGSESFQVVSIMIVDDSDGKFTDSDTANLVTNVAGSIASNPSNTNFKPGTSNGSITISRSDVMTMDEITNAIAGGDFTVMQTVKYMLTVK
jgi:hypothetical protein